MQSLQNVSVRFYSGKLLIWIKCQCQCQVWTPGNLIWQICAEHGTGKYFRGVFLKHVCAPLLPLVGKVASEVDHILIPKWAKVRFAVQQNPKGYQNGWFWNGKFFDFLELGSLVPVCFRTRLGVSLAAPKGTSKRMGFDMASCLSFEKLSFWCPFVFIPVWVPPRCCSDLFWTRVWCMPGLGTKNKSALFQTFPLLSAVLRVWGWLQNPRQTPVHTKLRLKRFPKVVLPSRNNQQIAKGAGGKGPRQKTSKIVKKCRKSSRSVEKFFDTFRQFSLGTIFPAPFGGLWNKMSRRSVPDIAYPRSAPRHSVAEYLAMDNSDEEDSVEEADE